MPLLLAPPFHVARDNFTVGNFNLLSSILRTIEFQVCKLLRHIALSESLQVSAKFTEINLRIYGPQVVTAAHTLARHPTSKIAKENLEGWLNTYTLYTTKRRKYILPRLRIRFFSSSIRRHVAVVDVRRDDRSERRS